MDEQQQQWQNTDEFLAIKFPGVPKSWLKEVCRNLGFLKGSGDMVVNWRPKSKMPRTTWTFIQNQGEGEASLK